MMNAFSSSWHRFSCLTSSARSAAWRIAPIDSKRSVGQRHEIRILGEQLNPKPCMIGGCPKAIRLGICGIEIRAWSIVALEDEPETDDSSSEFGDRPGKTAVGRYSLLAQPLVPSESLEASCVNALKYVSDDGP